MFNLSKAAIGCRLAQVLMQYCVLANHYWFFGEAIYLYSVLIASVFIDHNKYLPYICLGWGKCCILKPRYISGKYCIARLLYRLWCFHVSPGTPLLFVIPWMLAKLLKENNEWVCVPMLSQLLCDIDSSMKNCSKGKHLCSQMLGC